MAFFRVSKSGECEIRICFNDACSPPVESACNPSNGSLRWLPTSRLLYTGGGGSGISVASLFGREGETVWSSVHVMSELSPSMRYLLVGSSSTHQIFAEIDQVEIVELSGGTTVASTSVPTGADVHADWAGDAVKLTWAGGGRRVPLQGAGKLGADDGEWRPFSK
jgi:hypothetical protein